MKKLWFLGFVAATLSGCEIIGSNKADYACMNFFDISNSSPDPDFRRRSISSPQKIDDIRFDVIRQAKFYLTAESFVENGKNRENFVFGEGGILVPFAESPSFVLIDWVPDNNNRRNQGHLELQVYNENGGGKTPSQIKPIKFGVLQTDFLKVPLVDKDQGLSVSTTQESTIVRMCVASSADVVIPPISGELDKVDG